MKRVVWTEEWKNYLRKKYSTHTNEYLMRGLKRLGYDGTVLAMKSHASKILGLRKTEEWMKADRQRRWKIMIANRGEDFAERQRQRALKYGWFGGKHHDGCSLPKEVKAEIARKHLHTPEVRAKAAESRRKSMNRDKRRVALGLRPLLKMRNIGEAMTPKQKNIRYQMKYECRYITFKGDQHLYYDENTKRSERREKTAEERGVYIYPLAERKKFII